MTSRDHQDPTGSFSEAMATVLFTVLVLALPFVIDSGMPEGAFFALWLGGSCFAGMFAPLPVLAGIVGFGFVLFTVVMWAGVVDSEFFSDPLSIVALWMLSAGELVGLAAGFWLGRYRRRRAA